MPSFTPFLLSHGLIFALQLFTVIILSMLFVQCTHSMLFCEAVIYITAALSTRVRNSQLDATTEQNADLNPEGLELRTTLHVV